MADEARRHSKASGTDLESHTKAVDSVSEDENWEWGRRGFQTVPHNLRS